MNIIICAASFVILLRNLSIATPIQISNDLLQNLPLTLLTIEEKLTNLEKLVAIKCETKINEKLDLYEHKINNIEKTVSKLEVGAKMELEKITNNVNDKNMKQESILRNVESFYETINHKLTTLQEQVDVLKSEIKNSEEVVIAKLEKIEESVTVREGDLENELTETAVAIDDLKITFTHLEENTINLVKISTEKISKDSQELSNYYKQLQVDTKNISMTVTYMQEVLYYLQNQSIYNTEVIGALKEEILKSVNNYANKFTQVHSNLGQKTDSLDSKLQRVATITNLSRNELQNNLRSLIVQLGRLTGKQPVQNDYNTKLDELNKKVDANFQNILLSQTFFLESCHRVQMNEEQIESQISVILNKLLDIFENNTSNTANDLKQLDHTVRVHDSNLKQMLFNELQNVLYEITSNFNNQKQNIEKTHTLIQDLNSKNPTLLESILKNTQNLQKIIEKPQEVQENSNLSIGNVIENISFSLNNIEAKIDDYFSEKDEAKGLSQYKQYIFKHKIQKQNLSNLIAKIFGKVSKNEDGLIYFNGEIGNFNANCIEIKNAILLCNLKGTDCTKILNSTYVILRENESDYTIANCVPHYIDEDLLNCTLINSNNKKCLPSYNDLSDGQFNRENFIKCVDQAEEEKEVATIELLQLSKNFDTFDNQFAVESHTTSTESVTEPEHNEQIITNFIITDTNSNSKNLNN